MNINQILNSALLNEEVSPRIDDENKISLPGLPKAVDQFFDRHFSTGKVDKEEKMLKDKQHQANIAPNPEAPSALDNTLNWAKTNPGTTTAATLAALGAGLGAVALAKKLRAKKTQAKK